MSSVTAGRRATASKVVSRTAEAAPKRFLGDTRAGDGPSAGTALARPAKAVHCRRPSTGQDAGAASPLTPRHQPRAARGQRTRTAQTPKTGAAPGPRTRAAQRPPTGPTHRPPTGQTQRPPTGPAQGPRCGLAARQHAGSVGGPQREASGHRKADGFGCGRHLARRAGGRPRRYPSRSANGGQLDDDGAAD